jgi:hypothetical protein
MTILSLRLRLSLLRAFDKALAFGQADIPDWMAESRHMLIPLPSA